MAHSTVTISTKEFSTATVKGGSWRSVPCMNNQRQLTLESQRNKVRIQVPISHAMPGMLKSPLCVPPASLAQRCAGNSAQPPHDHVCAPNCSVEDDIHQDLDCHDRAVLRLCGVELGAEALWLWIKCGKSYRPCAIGPAIPHFQEHGFLAWCVRPANCRVLSWQASSFCRLLFAARSAIFSVELRSAARKRDRVVVVQEPLPSWRLGLSRAKR